MRTFPLWSGVTCRQWCTCALASGCGRPAAGPAHMPVRALMSEPDSHAGPTPINSCAVEGNSCAGIWRARGYYPSASVLPPRLQPSPRP